MIEHDMSLVLNICDPIYVLDFRKPLMTETPAEVRNSELAVTPTSARPPSPNPSGVGRRSSSGVPPPDE